MDVTLVTSCLLALIVSPFASGEPRAVCPNPTIQAVEGDAVTLPCYLDPPHSVVNSALDWTRADLNRMVYAYRHKQENHRDQMVRYRDRTTLHLEDLNRGILSLQISSVQLSDSGPYRCFVSRLMIGCVINVTVGEQETLGKDQQNKTKTDESSTTGPPEEEETEPLDQRMEAVWKTLIPVVVVAAAVGAVLFVLVKRGKIKICKKTSEEEMRREAEMKPNNFFEMENLRPGATERDED